MGLSHRRPLYTDGNHSHGVQRQKFTCGKFQGGGLGSTVWSDVLTNSLPKPSLPDIFYNNNTATQKLTGKYSVTATCSIIIYIKDLMIQTCSQQKLLTGRQTGEHTKQLWVLCFLINGNCGRRDDWWDGLLPMLVSKRSQKQKTTLCQCECTCVRACVCVCVCACVLLNIFAFLCGAPPHIITSTGYPEFANFLFLMQKG